MPGGEGPQRGDPAVGLPVCPGCRGGLREDGVAWVCTACAARWPVRDGFPRLLVESEVRGNDRVLRPFYEYLAPLHDPAVKYTLPLFGSGTEGSFRRAFLPRLELGGSTAPLRILEVGIGTGANLPLVYAAAGRPVEVWGIDLAAGMLRLCRKRLAGGAHDERLHGATAPPPSPGGARTEGREHAPTGRGPVYLAVADAHALPFPDASFDRVFHVGATNSFRDPRRALAEMARVARPGTPIVVVDERLDPHRRHSLLHRAIFRAICFYDPFPRPPTDFLPAGAWDVDDAQIARFLYCMRFRVGRAGSGPSSPG